jgi:integrase
MKKTDYTFEELSRIYIEDMDGRLKRTTMKTKRRIFDQLILPVFGKMHVSRITPADIRAWQNSLLTRDFSPSYLRLIYAELIGFFSYAVRLYDLPANPCTKAGPICAKPPRNIKIWTLEEFLKFIHGLAGLPEPRLAFLILFFTGLRCGELLALAPTDIDLARGIIHVYKTYTRQDGEDIITSPKTAKSIRDVTIPNFLCKEIENYLVNEAPRCEKGFTLASPRLFPHTKYYLGKYMVRACKSTGVKVIRLHDLRHSHASYLIDKGVQVGIISERLGHEKVSTTLDIYGHLYPSREAELARQMDEWMGCKPVKKV